MSDQPPKQPTGQVPTAVFGAAGSDPVAGSIPGIQFGIPPGALQQVTLAQASVSMWQSQYPPPDAVRKYEDILPGSFNRIITMVEQAQQSQIESVKTVNMNVQADARRGSWQGVGITVLAMVASIL